MRWQVVSKHGRRKRHFSIDAMSLEQATSDALRFIGGNYAVHSGFYGNQIWREGVISLTAPDGSKTVIYDPNA